MCSSDLVLDTTAARWFERFGDRARELSPLHNVRPGAPPAIIFHGTADEIVPFDQARAFAEAMHTVGSRCELSAFEGAGHGFFNYAKDPQGAYLETLRAADRFLASLGWLSGEPGI